MPKSLRCKIKKLCYNGALTERERDRILKALDHEPTGAKETIIKSALKYLVKMQIEEGSVGFAVDNDRDHDCRWGDVLAWLEAQSMRDATEEERKSVKDYIESISKPTGVQLNSNEFFNFDAPMVKNSEAESEE